jgi:hypothetical protein
MKGPCYGLMCSMGPFYLFANKDLKTKKPR